MEQRGDSPALVNHDGVTKSVFAHLVPAKGVDFPSCEKLLRWKGQERRRQTVFFLWTRSGTKETKNSTMICRGREKCTTNCEWKPHQDTVYWIHLARAQEQGLQFSADKVSRHDPFTIQCQPTASSKWYPRMETELCIKHSLRLCLLREEVS